MRKGVHFTPTLTLPHRGGGGLFILLTATVTGRMKEQHVGESA